MGIDVGRAALQARQISDYVSTLREVKNRLNCFKADLNSQWQAEEMIHINKAIDITDNKLSDLLSVLNLLSQDIITTANEIRREEAAAAAAAAAARAARTKR